MSGRILTVDSYDPSDDDRGPGFATATAAAGCAMFSRFVRINGIYRWEHLHPARRKVWIGDWVAGLEAFLAAGGRI